MTVDDIKKKLQEIGNDPRAVLGFVETEPVAANYICVENFQLPADLKCIFFGLWNSGLTLSNTKRFYKYVLSLLTDQAREKLYQNLPKEPEGFFNKNQDVLTMLWLQDKHKNIENSFFCTMLLPMLELVRQTAEPEPALKATAR
ncbi:hypothetical protein ACFORL_07360 [Legionella dresdenensis]|uniref:Uncharacterized protein n=1 Tax=Legionella dresdenensis TaxID=450200 RepID=A0ABV8CF12_9GAMM